MTLALVDPWDIEDGAIIRPIPGMPGSDGVVVAHDIDAHGDETYQLGDGRTYWHRHGVPLQVVITIEASADQIAAGDLIAEAGRIVRVVDVVRGLGVRVIRWASDERDGDGIPLVTGITVVRPEEMPRVRIRLIDRPEDLTEVAW